MKITVAEHGGFAAGIRREPRVFEVQSLPADVAGELERLVQAARTGVQPIASGPGRVRDGMSYTITVEDGSAQTLLKASDADMPEAFSNLLSWLNKHPGAR